MTRGDFTGAAPELKKTTTEMLKKTKRARDARFVSGKRRGKTGGGLGEKPEWTVVHTGRGDGGGVISGWAAEKKRCAERGTQP